MLKIIVGERNERGDALCTAEMSGGFMDNIAELLLAIRRIHQTVQSSNPVAAKLFQDALAGAMSDPEFWTYQPKGKVLERVSAFIPRKKS